MAQNTKIEWTDRTFNPWTGCTKISPGCDHCYAEIWSKRSGHVKWGNHPRRRTSDVYWQAPLTWQAMAAKFHARHGRRQRVFCASLADVFDNQVDHGWRSDLFDLICATPDLDWQILTKRSQNIERMLPADWGDRGFDNVWLGFTAEDQVRFDQRKRFMARIPARVWFVSYEPAIGALRIMSSDTYTYELRRHPVLRGQRDLGGVRPPNRGAKICPFRRSLLSEVLRGRAADMSGL